LMVSSRRDLTRRRRRWKFLRRVWSAVDAKVLRDVHPC
jgi:hypothetical protein